MRTDTIFYQLFQTVSSLLFELLGEELQWQTRFYEEVKEEVEEKAKEEGKLETIPRFLALGLSVEQIAQALELDVARVQQVADELSEN